jgi:hypothetical protein
MEKWQATGEHRMTLEDVRRRKQEDGENDKELRPDT